MQYQKNKSDQKEKKENTDSENGEMIYMEPIGNKIISPVSIGQEQSSENNENKTNKDQSQQPQKSHRTIIQTVKNDLKNRVDIAQLVDERPIHSIVVNVPSAFQEEKREKSPKTINIGSTKEEIEYNIKTLNPRKTPIDNNRYRTGTNPQGNDSRNFNSLNDSRGYQQINFGPRSNFSRSPDNIMKMKEYQFFPHDRRDGGGIIPFNQMSPNLNNYEDMNSSGEKIDLTQQTNNYRSIYGSSQRNGSARIQNRQILNIPNNNNLYQNDEVNEKYRNQMNNNMSYGDVKKIMRRFTKIYDPNRNNNGVLIESSQVTVPGASDDIFTNRFKVLTKMNRLSNILLSKKKRSPSKYQENSNLNIRSKSRSRSRSPVSIGTHERTGSPYMKKMPHNKFLYVSLAMLSSKGPKTEDRIILRKMRLDKGGVVDLAQEERKRNKYKIKKISKNKASAVSFYHTNPKYREIAAKIIQEWWAELKVLYAKKLKKIVLIQSVFRGKWVRKNMYDLLYLNYLYICFCRKIEKALSSHIRPLIFYRLFEHKKTESLILRNLIFRKEKRDNIQMILPFWKRWVSIIRNHNLKNKLGKQLIDIRSHKENKLNILLAFFNKWRYLTKISNIAPGQNINIYPLNKINGFCKIMDAAKKYVQKKALRKILVQLIKYLSVQARENILKKIVSKKFEFEKNILRNYIYYWYSKILNVQKISNEEQANKLREMKIKIFTMLLSNIKRRINNRNIRKYLIRLYIETHPGTINRYIIYEILRKLKIEILDEGEETVLNIHSKNYKIVKTKKDLRIIRYEEIHSPYREEEEKEQVIKDYPEIISNIHKEKK